MNNNCCILIPIYKQNPLNLEIISLKQCCKMLSDYQIIIITYKTLELSDYIDIFNKYDINYKVEYFPKYFFNGMEGYNALMYSDKFYKRFLNYNYILLYQLDAFVFSSDLEFWLDKSFDYIGAPWLDEIKHTMELKWHGYYNGGFCLKKTESFYRLCFTKEIIINKHSYILKEKLKKINNFFIRIILIIFQYYINLISKIFKIFRSNEDVIWSIILKKEGKVPSFNTALEFSFDRFPEYYFKLNNNKLPFGCHAWDLYYSFKFWEKYIKIN